MTNPNPQCLAVARLCENLATTVANTLDHIRRELQHTDGLKAATTDGTGSRGTATINVRNEEGELEAVPVTGVERTALQRTELTNARAQIGDDIRALALICYSLNDTCRKAAGTRIPTTEGRPRCYTDPGLDGYLLPRDEGGWSQPDCDGIPRHGNTGMCEACRRRLDRWRARQEKPLKPLDDERTIEHDSEVHIVNGVAIIRPTQGNSAA